MARIAKIIISVVFTFILIYSCQHKPQLTVVKYNFKITRGNSDIEYYTIIDTLDKKGNILSRTNFLTQKSYSLDSTAFEITPKLIRQKGYQIVQYYKLPIRKSDSCEIILDSDGNPDYKVCYTNELKNIFLV